MFAYQWLSDHQYTGEFECCHADMQLLICYVLNNAQSLFLVSEVFQLIVVVVKKPTKMKLVIILDLDFQSVSILCSLSSENNLRLYWVVLHSHRIVHVVVEG